MILWKYKYFVDVVDSKSFTKAGKKNYVSQTAISQQISALEKSVGGKLLDRGNGEIVVTELGQIVYDKAKEMLRLNEEMSKEIQLMKERPKINIGVDSSINHLFWEKLKDVMQANYNGSEERFGFTKIDPRAGGILLEKNKLDIFIGYGIPLSDMKVELDEEILCESQIGVYVGRQTTLKEKDELMLKDLEGYRRYETKAYPCSMQQPLYNSEADDEDQIQDDPAIDDNVDTMKLKVEFNDGYAFADSRFFAYEDGEIRLLSDYKESCNLKLFYRKEKSKKRIEKIYHELQNSILED